MAKLPSSERDALLRRRVLLRRRRWLNWGMLAILAAIVVDLLVVGITTWNWDSITLAVFIGGLGLGSRPDQLRRINSALRRRDEELADLRNDL